MGWKFYKDILPFAAMMVVECTTVGLKTIFKAASLVGMSYYVFMVYSYAIATLVLLPLPFIFGSRTDLPLFKLSLLYKFFLLGLIWFLSQLCGYSGIGYSSPTLASALSNLVPAFTFILAVIFRMEKLSIRRSSTQAKIMGTIISISGALVVLLYKGPVIFSTFSPSPSFQLESHFRTSQTNWVIGGLVLTAEYILLSIWYIVQSQVMKEYPEELIVVLWCNFWATIISAPVCFIAERNMNGWILKPGIAITATVLVLCSYMGATLERACLYFKLQTIVNRHCSCYGCHIPWGCSLSWEYCWSNDNINWVLWCNMGKSKRKRNGCGWWVGALI